MEHRISKEITNPKDIEFLLSLKDKSDNLNDNVITSSLIAEMFGEFNGKSRFNPYDTVIIPPNSYGPEGKRNKNSFKTTVGLWVFNKYFIETDLFDIIGYINKTVDSKVFDDINKSLSYALIEDKINTKQMKNYLMKTQLMMRHVSILSPNYTDKLLTCTKVINKKKSELLKKYKKDIERGDEMVGDKMEKELLAFAVDYMKDDPAMDMFISGARGSIGNNFKNMFVMKGVVKDPDPNAKQKYKVATSNYIDGISAEEYALFANTLAAGPYNRARKTAIMGYNEKLFLSAYQHITLDPPDSDCGTKKYITVTLDKKNIDLWMYCYVIQGNKLVEINSDNRESFIGKTVKMRFASLCESKTGICNKCMGNLFYKTNTTNIGAATPKIPSTLKNISMKSFHDSTQVFIDMDINKAFNV